jgi:hypothetical protein
MVVVDVTAVGPNGSWLQRFVASLGWVLAPLEMVPGLLGGFRPGTPRDVAGAGTPLEMVSGPLGGASILAFQSVTNSPTMSPSSNHRHDQTLVALRRN